MSRSDVVKRGEKPSEDIINLCRFLKHRMNWRNETKLTVGHFPETGRGLFSRKIIGKDSEIIELPFEAMISIKTVAEDEQFMQLLDGISHHGEFKWKIQTILTIYLLWNWHLGEKSTWLCYMKNLPNELSHPHFCSVDELVAIPVISERVLESVNLSEVREFQKAFQNASCPCCGSKFFPDIFPKRKFIEFYLICNSRTVYIPPEVIRTMLKGSKILGNLSNEPNMALAPFLDLINHSNDAKTTCSLFRRGSGYFYSLRTSSGFKRGEQIFINYGQHCNMKLLIEYGFFLVSNTNEYIEVTLKDIEELTRRLKKNRRGECLQIPSNKFKYIREHGLNEKMFFDEGGFSHNLQTVLNFLFVDQNVYDNLYHQVVFGNPPQEDDIKEYQILLIDLLLDIYRGSLRSLENLEILSTSGKIAKDFLKCRIAFMEKCLIKY
ncbi:SET domain-containing protein [Sergentomyia squamirostris]